LGEITYSRCREVWCPEGTMRQSNKTKPFSRYMALMCDLIERNLLALKNCSEERMDGCHDKRILFHYKE
jgi:hypothetical protein